MLQTAGLPSDGAKLVFSEEKKNKKGTLLSAINLSASPAAETKEISMEIQLSAQNPNACN